MKIINQAFSWYFTKQALPYWTILLLDCIIVLLCEFFIEIFNSSASFILLHLESFVRTSLLYLVFYIIGFRVFHTYDVVVRFSSFIDLQRIGFAVLFGFTCSLIWQYIGIGSKWLMSISYTNMALTSMIAVFLMWGIRICVKILHDDTTKSDNSIRAFVYGVKEGGIAIAKSINTQEKSSYYIAGFVSDKSDMVGKQLMGKRVYSNDDSLIETMRNNHVSALLVSPLKAEVLRENNLLIDRLIESGVKIFMIPLAKEWNGKSDLIISQLKEVNVEDLLPREKIEVDMEAIGNLLSEKRILITGAAGSIGSEMVRQIAPYNPSELILIDQAETPLHDIRLMMAKEWSNVHAHTIIGDIANEKRMDEIFNLYRPEYVFHAAAYKHVPMMEDNPSESIENNVNGTRIIADLSVKYGTKKFVMVSTDKAVNPTNVMGCSKRLCEIYVQSLDNAIKEGIVKGVTRFVTTRFGNVLGSNGSVIPLFERRIKAGGPVTVTHPDIIRFFMLIPEACKLVLEAGTMGHGGEIYVFDMGKPVRIADLAKRMIQMSGAKDIEIQYTGLRDGEKLYEEVLNDEETTLPTFHDKIKIAKVREYKYDEVNKQILDLIHLAIAGDDMSIVSVMKRIVPEFKSQHSKYEQLDM